MSRADLYQIMLSRQFMNHEILCYDIITLSQSLSGVDPVGTAPCNCIDFVLENLQCIVLLNMYTHGSLKKGDINKIFSMKPLSFP